MTVHESVAIGAFCYAAGAVFVDLRHLAHQEGQARKPITNVFNFSHNPLDPAVGDLIFEDASDGQMYYILEFKKDLHGIREECKKRHEQGRQIYTDEELRKEYPAVRTAHLLAWLVPAELEIAGDTRKVSQLVIAPYWKSLACVQLDLWEGCDKLSAHRWLRKVSDPMHADKPKGFSLDELARYIQHINQKATGKAASGASSFVMTFKDYRFFAADEKRALELLHLREVSQQVKHEPPEDEQGFRHSTPF